MEEHPEMVARIPQHYLASYLGMQHGTVGGVHGKIGFGFIALGIYHFIKRIRFYRSKKLKKCD